MARHSVESSKHPNCGEQSWPQRHGPFDTKKEAEDYAARLRRAVGWGEVKVVPAARGEGKNFLRGIGR